MLPTRGDGMLRTPQAASLAGVTPATVRKWRERGRIMPDGYDERGWPLYRPATVTAAEALVRQHGLDCSGIDPRRLRKRVAA